MRTRKIKTSREIGGKIKKKRRELGISQEELAEILGVTYQQVQRYENGINKLNVENIQVITSETKQSRCFAIRLPRIFQVLAMTDKTSSYTCY